MADETKTGDDQEIGGITVPLPSISDTQTNRKSLIVQTASAVVDIQKAVDANQEAIEKLKAQNEAGMRREALYFSWFVFGSYFYSHIIFFAYGHPLVLPPEMTNFIWTLILAPWGAHSVGKLAQMVSDKLAEKKA